MQAKSPSQSHRAESREQILLVNELLEAWNVHDIDHAVIFYVLDYTGIDVVEAVS